MINRKLSSVHSKGFNMFTSNQLSDLMPAEHEHMPTDFSKIQIGTQRVEDGSLEFSDFYRTSSEYGDKKKVLDAIFYNDYFKLREISNFFFKTSGIYARLCQYYATLYKYDWFVVPHKEDTANTKSNEKLVTDFRKILKYFDKSEIKRFCIDTGLKVIKNGVYYGYRIDSKDRVSIQELPPEYCRSTNISIGNKTLIEFNLEFFNRFKDEEIRTKMIKMFPPEFEKAWRMKERRTLPKDSLGRENSPWFALDITKTVRFCLYDSLTPLLAAMIPDIIDLGGAQELDRKKMQQQLLKLIIQKMPIDKNGDLIFDVDEAKQLHNNAVRMIGKKAIGLDVLTTFADTSVETLNDRSTATTNDDLEKVERTLFNDAGTAKLLFNADNSVALEKSIINDEALMINLVLQFQSFFNEALQVFNTNKKYYFTVEFLPTTIYNYQTLSKTYKEQMQIGYSKMLSQIALGHSQSSILDTAEFENEVLKLVEVFIPPASSSTMSGNNIKNAGSGSKNPTSGDKKESAGRPTNEEQGKATTEKTIANRESKGNG